MYIWQLPQRYPIVSCLSYTETRYRWNMMKPQHAWLETKILVAWISMRVVLPNHMVIKISLYSYCIYYIIGLLIDQSTSWTGNKVYILHFFLNFLQILFVDILVKPMFRPIFKGFKHVKSTLATQRVHRACGSAWRSWKRSTATRSPWITSRELKECGKMAR